jgi:PKD repeat protein
LGDEACGERVENAMKNRMSKQAIPGLLLAACAVAVLGQTGTPEAGKITAGVPVNYVVRERKQLEGKKDMAVQWGDVITTERGGRVRVRLNDGSVLNVGSQSSLLIQQHDAGTQNTQLELIYGRVRANATRIVAPGGEFKVRTKSAVAGIVGTEEYVESSDISTKVIALGGGMVTVTSTDPRFPDPTVLSPGETTTVVFGRAPAPKRVATAEELQRAVQETESDPIVNLSPNLASPGRTIQAVISGQGLADATGFTFTHPGIQAQRRGAATATAIPVTITVSDDVPPGTYTLTVARPAGPAQGAFVVTSPSLVAAVQEAAPTPIEVPPGASYSGIRGTNFSLDATGTRTPTGTQIISYQWRVLNTSITSNDPNFVVDTSVLAPGNYTVQLTVVNDRGQTATQSYSLTVEAGLQPGEIVQALALAYESLQPTEFLKYFDEQRFRNFAGFAASVEDSFRNQLETIRVFQRAVNCSIIEEQDQAVCQADFEVQFTKKDQPLELLDANGNPVPPGTTPPPGSALGKRVLSGTERTTIRYERADQGWKIADYAAVVSCPGGTSTTGVNSGSCILALGSSSSPSFQLANVQVFATDLPLGGMVGGTLEIVPLAGFTGQVMLTGQGVIANQSASVQFGANPASPGIVVMFTIVAPVAAPMGFSGPTPFTLVITGQELGGTLSTTVNIPMVLQPDFNLTVQPATSASAPAAVTHNSTFPIQVSVIPGAGFTGSVVVSLPNPPAGFTASTVNVTAGGTVPLPVQVSAAAAPGPAALTVQAIFGGTFIKTSTVFLDVTSDFTLTATSTSGFVAARGTSIPIDVTVVPISGFAASVLVDFPGLPAGFAVNPTSATVSAGGTAPFTLTVPAGATVGATPITIRGTFATSVVTLVVNLTVQSILPAGRVTAPEGATQETQSGVAPAAPDAETAAAPVATQEPRWSRRPKRRDAEESEGEPGIQAVRPLDAPTGFPRAGGAVQADGREPDENRTGSATGLPAAQAPAGGAPSPSGPRPRAERGQVFVVAGGCAGFRFSSAGETACGSGADFELSANENGQLRIEAEGVMPVGAASLEQAVAQAGQIAGRSESLRSGATYLVQLARGRAAVRIVQVRRAGAPNAPPPPLRKPGVGATGGRPAAGSPEGAARAGEAGMLVTIEWLLVPE